MNLKMQEEQRPANTVLAKVAVKRSADPFVVNQSLVLHINICGENRHFRQAAKLWEKSPFGTILISLIFIGCENYPLTTFYVKNNSDKPIIFNATVMKHSQKGSFYINQPFTVQVEDSVLTRKIGYKIDGQNPENWFTEFKIFPIDSLEFNDPKQPQN